jgi:hypothetical protein
MFDCSTRMAPSVVLSLGRRNLPGAVCAQDHHHTDHSSTRLGIRVSRGKANMQPAAPRKAAALTYSGKEMSRERSRPVRMGAMIPASRLSAEAIPHAVARTRASKTSGVYPVEKPRKRDVDLSSARNEGNGGVKGEMRLIPYITASE